MRIVNSHPGGRTCIGFARLIEEAFGGS